MSSWGKDQWDKMFLKIILFLFFFFFYTHWSTTGPINKSITTASWSLLRSPEVVEDVLSLFSVWHHVISLFSKPHVCVLCFEMIFSRDITMRLSLPIRQMDGCAHFQDVAEQWNILTATLLRPPWHETCALMADPDSCNTSTTIMSSCELSNFMA